MCDEPFVTMTRAYEALNQKKSYLWGVGSKLRFIATDNISKSYSHSSPPEQAESFEEKENVAA